ncbi:hypothetical protein DSO57_1002670 [Entomophthora muscae]|uniref:Uncharacterized protein n=1 Tax=Entomophthora muscae TaxID=34485 RepID=A0ACC2TK16_9FUNG|nr:hypothetical protein DSO57_1002670 [Entomophthora muscae]
MPVPEHNPSSTKPTKAAQKLISEIKFIIFLRLIQESGTYKMAAALVGLDLKYANKVLNKYIDTGQVLAAEKSFHVSTIFLNQTLLLGLTKRNGDTTRACPTLRVSTMPTKEHKWAIHQWID